MRSLATSPDTRVTSAPGESRNQHFTSGAAKVHNGMNENRGVGRFGNDTVDPFGGDDRHYDAGAWEGPSLHDRLTGEAVGPDD